MKLQFLIEETSKDIAFKKHKTQLHKLKHVKGVAKIVKKITKNPEIRDTAYLHDTIERTKTTPKEIKRKVGKNVSKFVKELTIDKTLKGKQKSKQITKDMNTMSNEALLVRLADRLEKLQSLNPNDKNKYLKKTEKIMSSLDRNLNKKHVILINKIKKRIKELEE